MTSSDTVTNVFHDSLCLSNLLVKRIDLKLCVSQNLKKMLCLIIYRVYKMFDWFAGDGFRCSSALCLLLETVFFYFQTNRERKIDNKKFGRKKRFPQFLLCMYVCVYVCVYVCLCVCLSVRALQTSSFNIGG
jgi:hypothetical protein